MHHVLYIRHFNIILYFISTHRLLQEGGITALCFALYFSVFSEFSIMNIHIFLHSEKVLFSSKRKRVGEE